MGNEGALVPVSVMVFTLNEEVNLPSCLESLKTFDDVIVVDSHSRDRTEAIARAAGARFFQHAFTGFGDQRNWAMEHAAPRHEWVLVLDADERVPAELAEEIRRTVAAAGPDEAAFRLKRRFFLWGRWLRHSSLYPTWVVRLVRRGRVRYENRGHAETQVVQGKTGSLRSDLIDENRKGVEDWLERQDRYSTREAEYEAALGPAPDAWRRLFSGDPLERRAAAKRLASGLPCRGAFYFLYSYVLRLGFLDGPKGLRFCLMKAAYHGAVGKKARRLRAGKGAA